MDVTMMKLKVIVAAIAVFMSGCSTVATQRTESAIAAGESAVATLKAQVGLGAPNAATTKVSKPYYGSKSVPFKARSILPAKFREVYQFRYPLQSFTLQQVAEKLASVSGIPVRVEQALPTQGRTGPAPTDNQGYQLNTSATMESVLDQVCRTFNVHWEFTDGAVVIQRLMTRSFTLKVQPGDSGFDFSLGKSNQSQAAAAAATGGGSGTIATGFTSTSKVNKTAEMTPMTSAVDAVTKVLTKDGKVIGSQATGSITVIDTPDGVLRAEKIIDRENEILTRVATFHIEVISFRANDLDHSGIDWQVAFSNLNKVGATLTSPKTLTNSLGGTLGVQLLQGSGGLGKFDGTKAFITMLNQYGSTHTVYKNDIRTRNRSTTTVQSLSQTVYIARTTPAPAGINGAAGGTPGLEPGTVTAGVDLKMQPTIFDSNQISLLFNLGIVDLSDIVPLTSGVGSNQMTIQGPETAGFEFQEETSLTPGVTTLISGYERTLESYTKRKLGRDMPAAAGGSYKGEQQKERLFIFITPTVVGSMY